MKATNQNGTQYRVYDSVEELLGAVAAIDDSRVIETDVKRQKFIGRSFRTWGGVYAASRSQWQDGIATLEGMLAELASEELPKPKSRKRRTRFDDAAGDEVDYDRLRGGQDFWRVTRRESTDGPATLTLFVDVTAAARVSWDLILWRGAAAIALAKLLEDAGYRVELWAVFNSRDAYPGATNANTCAGVCLKRTSDPLDVSTLINAVSGWFFRTVYFREIFNSDDTPCPSKGRCTPVTDADMDQFSTDARRHLVADIWNSWQAAAFVRDKLAELAS
jgi:hypothetical protein